MQGTTTKLSFTTEGSIHRLSDSGFSPIPGAGGSGLKGDFEFLYYGKSANGDTLTFRTNRVQSNQTYSNVRFVRAGSDAKNLLTEESVIEKMFNKTVYQELIFDPGNGLKLLKASIDFNRTRTLTIKWFIEKITATGTDTSYFDTESEHTVAIDFLSENKIKLEFLRLNDGKLLRNVILEYDPAANSSKSIEINGESDNSITLGPREEPFIITTDYLDLIDPAKTRYIFFNYQDQDVGHLTTSAFNAIYDSYGLRYFILNTSYTYYNYSGRPTIREVLFCPQEEVGKGDNHFRQLKYSVDSNKKRLIFLDRGDLDIGSLFGYPPDAPPIHPSGEKFLGLLTDPKGFYVENLGRVTRFRAQIYTLTSVSNPAVRMAFYHYN